MSNFIFRLPIFLLFTFFSFSIMAQEVTNEGVAAYERNAFDEAKNIFAAQLLDKRARIAGEYGMALLHSNKDYKAYDIFKANDYIMSAKTNIKEAKKKTLERLRELKVSSREINRLVKTIQADALAQAQTENTETAYNELLDKVKFKMTQRKNIERRRDSLVVQGAEEKDTYDAYSKVLDTYGKAMRRTNKPLYLQVEKMQFKAFTKEKGLAQFDAFASANPRHHFVKDSGQKAFLNIHESKKIKDYELFVNQYRSSVYVSIANERIAEIKIKNKKKEIKRAKGIQQHKKLVAFLQPQLDAKDWSAALAIAKEFEKECKRNEYYQELIALLEAPDQNITIKPLGSGVNSRGNEYSPTISGDGKTIYFCGTNRGNNLGNEDIFVSNLVDGVWQRASVVGDLCTVPGNEAPQSVSTDGNNIIVFNNGQLAFSQKTATGWKELENYPYSINFSTWQSDGLISADGQHLIFVSNQNTGNFDIFVSKKQSDGTWGKPMNMGEGINTKYAERDPFLHPDMKTLYFSSDGRGGLGGLDVFVSTRLDDTWTNWSKPKNIGRELNTTSRDWGYKITTDGKKAIFAATNLAYSKSEDLYEALLPEELQPAQVTTISGTIKGLDPLESATLIINDKNTGDLVGEYLTEPGTGKYFIVVPIGIEAVLTVKKQGIVSAPQEIKFDISKDGPANIEQDIEVADIGAIEKGKSLAITFDDDLLLFDTDKDLIKDAFKKDLNRIIEAMKGRDLKLSISGHTDNIGEDSYNLNLSERRAQAVRKYFIDNGIDATLITAKGFGESQPVDTNDTDKGRANNRRVEIKFVKE